MNALHERHEFGCNLLRLRPRNQPLVAHAITRWSLVYVTSRKEQRTLFTRGRAFFLPSSSESPSFSPHFSINSIRDSILSMSATSVTVKSTRDGTLLLYSRDTRHLLQRVKPPSAYIRNRVSVSSSGRQASAASLTPAAKRKMIQGILKSDRELVVLLDSLDFLPDAGRVARSLSRPKGRPSVTFADLPDSAASEQTESLTEEEDESERTSVVLLSACGSEDVSDVSSLATNSWTPSEQGWQDQREKEKAKRSKELQEKDSGPGNGKRVKQQSRASQPEKRVNPLRMQKAAARRRFRRRRPRVYDF